MNKFIYPLAAAAALFTGNLFAQEAALSSAENSTTSMYDCVKTVSDANRTLDFEGGVVTQEFTACTTGQLQGATIAVKGAAEGAVYIVELVDYLGSVVDMIRFSKKDLVDGEVTLPLIARVKEGKNYAIQITAPAGKNISLRYKQGPMGTLWNNGSPVRGELTSTLGFLSREVADVSAMNEGRGDFAAQNRALEGQCKTQVVGHDFRISLDGLGNEATQTFTACSKGVLEHLSVGIQTSFPDFQGRFNLLNADGDVLHSQEISASIIENGVLNLPLNVRVEQGDELMFGIKTGENQRIALHTNSMGREGVLKRNGQTIESNLEFTAYIAETNDTPARIELKDAKITTFPNPFSDRISVRLENVNEGKAVIQLLDFSGNVLRSDMVFVKNHEGEITFETRDIERPGYYALRVIQGDSVKNTTIMKR